MTRLFGTIVALVLLAGCSGDGPLTPSPAGRAARTLAGTTGAHVAALPPTLVPDIDCAHDAPRFVRVSSHDGSLDIEWSQIPRVQGYQVEVQRYESINAYVTLHVIELPDNEEAIGIRPSVGRYRARVRSRVCGGFGNWSSYVLGSIDGVPLPPVPMPTPTPDPCVSLKHVGGPPSTCTE